MLYTLFHAEKRRWHKINRILGYGLGFYLGVVTGHTVSVVTAQTTTKPTTKPTTHPTPPTPRPTGHSLRPLQQPFVSGWLSFTLGPQERIWLDGHLVGQGIVPYLRLQQGQHSVKILHPTLGTQTLNIQVRANRHTILWRSKKRLGLRLSPWEQSNVSIRQYRTTGKVSEQIRTPGVFCIRPRVCPLLTPGDRLYMQSDGKHLIVSPTQAVKHAQSYRAKPGDGFLTLYSYPPGALYLNQRMVAMAPVAQLPLRPGKYNIAVKNGFLQMEWDGRVEIKTGQEVRKVIYTTLIRGSNLVVFSKTPARIYLNGLYKGWTPAHVLPLPTGKEHHTLRLDRPDGSSKTYTLEIHPGQLEMVTWD